MEIFISGLELSRRFFQEAVRPLLPHAQQASTWNERADALAHAYEVLARLQNALGVCRALPTTTSPFYDRPFPVIHGEQFAQALVEQITDPAVRRLAAGPLIGNINQWSDNVAMEGVNQEKLKYLYTSIFFPAIHSILDPSALLREVLPLYDLDGQTECLFFARGVNDTYLVQIPAEKYILRIYRTGWRTLSDILYEVDVLNHLSRKGIPVSLPVAQRDGGFIHTLLAPEGPRHLVLFTYAPGAPLNRHDAADSYYHGRALSAIHSATDGFSSVHARGALDLDYLISQSLQAIRPFQSSSSADWNYLEDLAERLRLRIQQLSLQGLDWGVCHGDCHMLNEHVGEDRTIRFFDFDCCAAGWRAYDLAIVRWSEGFYQMDPDDTLWNAFLKGYTEQRSLTEADLASIPAFVALREIWHTALIAWLQPGSGVQGFDRIFQRTLRLLRDWETIHLK